MRTISTDKINSGKLNVLLLTPSVGTVNPISIDGSAMASEIGSTPLCKDGNFYSLVGPAAAVPGRNCHPVCVVNNSPVSINAVDTAVYNTTYQSLYPYTQYDAEAGKPYAISAYGNAGTYFCKYLPGATGDAVTSVSAPLSYLKAYAYNEAKHHSLIANASAAQNGAIFYASGVAGQAHAAATHPALPSLVSGFATTPNISLAFANTKADNPSGVLKSTDGATWTVSTPIPTTWGADVTVRYGEFVDDKLWLYTNKGLLFSTDDGNTWQRAHDDMNVVRLFDLGVDGLISYGRYLRKSTDHGATWTTITDFNTTNYSGALAQVAGSLVYDPNTKIFYGVYGYYVFGIRIDGTIAFQYNWNDLSATGAIYSGASYTQASSSIVFPTKTGILATYSNSLAGSYAGYVEVPFYKLYSDGKTTYQLSAVGGGGAGVIGSGTATNGKKSEIYGIISAAGGSFGKTATTGCIGYRPGQRCPTTASTIPIPGGVGPILNGVEVGTGGSTGSAAAATTIASGSSGTLASATMILPEGTYLCSVGMGGDIDGGNSECRGADGGILIEEM